MSNATEPVLNGKHEVGASRIADLEAENERLRADLARLTEVQSIDRQMLIAHMMDDLPKSEEEFLKLAREGPSFRELLDELGFTAGRNSKS